MYYPILIFLACHIVLMCTLHFTFSDAKMYWSKGGFLNLSFFHYMVGNGLANIYIHNWIRMDPLLIPFSKPLQHVSTLVRQLVFDFIFASENVILLVIALNSNILELHENKFTFTFVLLGFTMIGLILKCVYYRYLHIWAWLIMDYITKKEDGHWKCILFSNMYLCGTLKERELLLCCVPRPLNKCLNMVFGERYFSSTGSSCSWCSAVITVFLIPVAFALGLVALVVVCALILLFLPIFIGFILPCVIVSKCRNTRRPENIIKIVDSESARNFDDLNHFGLNNKRNHSGGEGDGSEGFPLQQTGSQRSNAGSERGGFRDYSDNLDEKEEDNQTVETEETVVGVETTPVVSEQPKRSSPASSVASGPKATVVIDSTGSENGSSSSSSSNCFKNLNNMTETDLISSAEPTCANV